MKLNLSLKGRPLAFYLELAASAAALILGIVFFIIDRTTVLGNISFKDFVPVTFAGMVAGGLLGLVHCFVGIPYLDIASCALMGVAVGQHLSMSCYPWADISTGVAFFVNDGELLVYVSGLFTAFLVIFAVVMVVNIVAAFLPSDR